MKKEIIVMMGGQGVGKGTFSKMLRAQSDYNYIETGATLRALPPESEIAQIIARGELVSDKELFNLMQDTITDEKDIIMDGFPRTTAQAQWLVEHFADKFNIHILYLDVPEEIMLERINKRINGGAGRADDADMAAVRRRLDTFWHTTVPAIEWLRTADGIKFSDVDVCGAVDDNFANIMTALKK